MLRFQWDDIQRCSQKCREILLFSCLTDDNTLIWWKTMWKFLADRLDTSLSKLHHYTVCCLWHSTHYKMMNADCFLVAVDVTNKNIQFGWQQFKKINGPQLTILCYPPCHINRYDATFGWNIFRRLCLLSCHRTDKNKTPLRAVIQICTMLMFWAQTQTVYNRLIWPWF